MKFASVCSFTTRGGEVTARLGRGALRVARGRSRAPVVRRRRGLPARRARPFLCLRLPSHCAHRQARRAGSSHQLCGLTLRVLAAAAERPCRAWPARHASARFCMCLVTHRGQFQARAAWSSDDLRRRRERSKECRIGAPRALLRLLHRAMMQRGEGLTLANLWRVHGPHAGARNRRELLAFAQVSAQWWGGGAL